MTTATGYASASDRIAFFGMGEDVQAKSVVIEWPSGTTQTLMDVKCDRYLKVEEP